MLSDKDILDCIDKNNLSVRRIPNKVVNLWTFQKRYEGDIFVITDNETEEEKESCWGFYGEDDCLEEAKSITHYLQTEKDKEEQIMIQKEVIVENMINQFGGSI